MMFMIHDVDCGGEILGRILHLQSSKNDPGYDWDSEVNLCHTVFSHLQPHKEDLCVITLCFFRWWLWQLPRVCHVCFCASSPWMKQKITESNAFVLPKIKKMNQIKMSGKFSFFKTSRLSWMIGFDSVFSLKLRGQDCNYLEANTSENWKL